MTPWRLLRFAWRGAAENMALDEALLRLAERPTLRLYGWRPAALSIGYSQQPPEGWTLPLVRRQTGGGAIWHEREVTYSLSGHEDDLGARNDLRGLYRRAHAGIAAGLSGLGIQAHVKEDGEARGRNDPFACFEKAAAGDLLVVSSGLKIAGSAQRRLRRRLLLHGSVMLAQDPRNGSSGTGIREVLGKDVDPETLAVALAEGFAASFGATFEAGSLSDAEEALAERLLVKYESAAWTRKKDGADE